jgi:lipoprotein
MKLGMKNSWVGWSFIILVFLSGCTNTLGQDFTHVTINHKNQRSPYDLLGKMFGVSVQLPTDFNSYKQGKHFLWLSNNDVEVVKSIALYSVKRNAMSALSVLYFCHLRDSVMYKNVRGITDVIYMKPLQESVRVRKSCTSPIFWYEGLWEMQNDAMGGDFICRAINRPFRHDILFAEAILYAPGIENKTILIRQLQAVLQSIK